MSKQIRFQQKEYYDVLERTQSRSTDVTEWLTWFLGCYVRAVESAQLTLTHVLRATRFWSAYPGIVFNERQKRMLNLVLHGYEGGLNTRNWARLGDTSKDTAQRDLSDLAEKGVLRMEGAGRSTRYELIET